MQNIDWEVVLQGIDSEVMLDTLLTTILRACEGNVPAKKKSTRKGIILREQKILIKRRATLNKRIHKATDIRQSSLQAKVCDIEKKNHRIP
ncbi:hypothetical protein E2C01_057495 [Portunus trituberculatus]|uniref:Uncharacterized protein n=1 Tax=Portunus trituberculatus TaxID=210409 RepID=A0A5B7H217_PORTR|nr:hypothetical protein [Portunus trituberculatus]